MKIDIPKNFFSSNDIDDLEERLQFGIVEFSFVYVTTTEEHSRGQIRFAKGTRNLDYVDDWTQVPFGGRIVPPEQMTYYDMDKHAWRCFIKDKLIWYDTELELSDDIAQQIIEQAKLYD